MCYPYSENKGARQLRGYREADLRLCFRTCRLLVFSRCSSNIIRLRCQSDDMYALLCHNRGPQWLIEILCLISIHVTSTL